VRLVWVTRVVGSLAGIEGIGAAGLILSRGLFVDLIVGVIDSAGAIEGWEVGVDTEVVCG
jgi:hypothetical protein